MGEACGRVQKKGKETTRPCFWRLPVVSLSPVQSSFPSRALFPLLFVTRDGKRLGRERETWLGNLLLSINSLFSSLCSLLFFLLPVEQRLEKRGVNRKKM